MSLPSFSARRPVLTVMVTLIVVTLGMVSLGRLPIDLLPDIERPVLSVKTEYPGASPEVMEQRVTRIVEEIIAVAPGVEQISSYSMEGESDIRVSFSWNIDVDAAALDLQARLDQEVNELPTEVIRPRIRKFDINDFPVVLLGVESDLDPVELSTLIETQLRYRLARLPGIAQVDLWGAYEREVRVELDPVKLQALSLPIDRIVTALRDANLDLPAGRVQRGRYEVTLRAPAQYHRLADIEETAVTVREGQVVTIGQLGKVVDTYQRQDRIVRINGKRGMRIAIRKQSDANTVDAAREILGQVEKINRAFPQVTLHPLFNQGSFIERSIANVSRSVLYGGALAVLVLAFFLRSLSSTIIVGLAIPIALIATFALIFSTGMTINLMTLGGLALGVGMMVDNAIVVLENIVRCRQEEGLSRLAAAQKGAEEVAPAIVASTVTTLVIFLPLMFAQGVTGVMFRELSMVVVFSLLCSLLTSLSLVPMLAARGRDRPGASANPLPAAGGVLSSLSDRYGRLLRRSLEHKLVVIAVSMLLLGGSLFLVPLIGTEFMPTADESEVVVMAEMEVGTRLELVNDVMATLERRVVDAVPELTARVSEIQNARGFLRLSLVPPLSRARSSQDVANELRTQLRATIPGAKLYAWMPRNQLQQLDSMVGGGEGLSIQVRGFELPVLDRLSRRVERTIQGVQSVEDVKRGQDDGAPQDRMLIDRQKVAALGLSMRDVATALETAVAGRAAGEYRPDGDSFRILVQLQNVEHMEVEEILQLPLITSTGAQVALGSLVSTTTARGPKFIERLNQQRVAYVSANVADRDLGSVAKDVIERLDRVPRPSGYAIELSGAYEDQQEAFDELLLSLLLALALVYMVMASQYESLIDPLVVMASVPVAAVGVFGTLFATGSTFNVQSYIGCIMLGGIAVNNAILLVDQAGRLRAGGLSAADATVEAGRRRLRPILMTTSTTVLGLLPLSLGLGEGADAQSSLARAVLGGLFASTLITLLLIPVVYTLVHSRRRDQATAMEVSATTGGAR